MNSIKTTIVIVIGVLIFGAVYFFVQGRRDSEIIKTDNEQGQDAMMDNNIEDEAMMKDTTGMQNQDVDTKVTESQVSKWIYADYSSETVASARADGQKVVLFFWAAWCPFCKAADAEFQSNLEEIPGGVTLLKTNYDTETELKQKYGVTYQHTFVQIDSSGEQLAKWAGGGINELKTNLK